MHKGKEDKMQARIVAQNPWGEEKTSSFAPKLLVAAFLAALALPASLMAVETVWYNPAYKWQPSGDGPHYWNDPANWEKANEGDATGHQPTSFQVALFDAGGTVLIPAATAESPFIEGSLFDPRVGNFPRGDKLVVDGSGTYWLKQANPDDTIQTANYLNLVDFDGYFWGGEGGHDPNNPAAATEFLATNVVIEIERAAADEADGATLTLKQGYMNFYDPLGRTDHSHTFNICHTFGANAQVIYEEGTHTRTRELTVRNHGLGSLFWVKGGLHEIFNNLRLGWTSHANPVIMRMSGGTVDVQSGWIIVGFPDKMNDATPVGRLVMDGTGSLCHTNNNTTYIGWGVNGTEGYLEMSGNSSFTASQVHLGARVGSRGFWSMSGNASATVNNHLYVGKANDSDGLLDISGGMLTFGPNSVLVCGDASNAHARVSMTGGKIVANNGVWFGNAQYSTNTLSMTGGEVQSMGDVHFHRAEHAVGDYRIGGDAKFTVASGKMTYLGNASNTDTELVIGDDAEVSSKFWFGSTSLTHSDSRLIVTNNAVLHFLGEHFTLGAASTNSLVVADNATLDIAANSVLGWRNDANSFSELVLDGNMKLTGTGQILVGQGSNASVCRAYLRGGSSLSQCGNVELYGQNSLFEVSGGDFTLNHLYVYQAAGWESFTNAFRVTGGKIRFNDWTVVGNNNIIGRIEVDGGEFSTREINLGFGNQVADQMCVMRVTGGTVKVEQGTGDAWFQLGNGTGNASRGRLEQTGGEICAHSIRGNHSASGRSEAFFDGGKVVQTTKVHGSYALIQDITSAVVGATGLTVDSNGFSAYLKQEFIDAGDGEDGTVDGVVRITGLGSVDIRKNSNHAKTVVDGGRMSFSNGATVFGRTVQLVNGGVYSLEGDATSFSFDHLVLGDTTSAGVLKLDAGDTITITGEDGLEVNNLVLDVSHMTENGNFAVFTTSGSGTIDPDKLGKVTLKAADPYKSYTLNANGTVTVSDREFAETSWTGEISSLWSENGNWSSLAPSGEDAKAVFGNVANKSVQTSSGASAGVFQFTAGGYTISGADSVSLGVAVDNEAAGEVSFESPVDLGKDIVIAGVSGSTTAFEGPLSGTGVAVTKNGSGKVVVSGNNAALDAAWAINGGTLDFASENAIETGVNLVTIGSGTIAYTGENEATAGGSLLINAETGVGAIVDTAGDLTFTNAEVRSGRFVKKGAGSLTFDLGAGTYPFADMSDVRVGNNGNLNVEVSTDIAFNASGDSQPYAVSADMFYPLTVAEGRVVFSGAGSNATTVVHRNGLSVGDTYAGAQANSEMVLKNVFFDNANVDAFIVVGRKVNSSANAEPWLKVLDSSLLHAHKMWIGWNSTVPVASGLAVTNSTVMLNGRMSLGGGANATAVLRVGPGGKVQVNDSFDFRGKVDILVEGEGAEISAPNNNCRDDRWGWSGILQFEDYNGSGTIAVKNGGSLTLGGHIHGSNYGVNGTTSPGLRFVFDGGTLRFLSSGTSMMARPQYQYARTEGAGMTVSVAEGAVQKFTFPIRGNGGFVKTGGGELVFTDVRDFTAWAPQVVIDGVGYFNLQYSETDMMLAAYEGSTEVREGILTLFDGMLTNTTAVTVGEAGALNLGGNAFEFPSVAGSGVVSNGTLNAVIKVAMDSSSHTGEMPSFSDVVLPANQMFDFDFGDGAMELRVPYTLSRMGVPAGAMSGWKAVSGGRRAYPVFSVDSEGRAVVTLHNPPGTLVIVR